MILKKKVVCNSVNKYIILKKFNCVYLSCKMRCFDIHCYCFVIKLCPTLCDLMDYSPPGSSVREDSLGKNTGVGCLALFQGIFQT